MAKTAKQLREDRAKLIADARALNDEHQDDNGNLSSDRQAAFDKMMDDAAVLHDRAKQLERLEAAEAGLNEPNNNPLPSDHPMENPGRGGFSEKEQIAIRSYGRNDNGTGQYSKVDIGKRGASDYRKSFSDFLAKGMKGLNPERIAALQSDDDEQAGYLVASEQFAAGLLKEVDDLLFVRRYARIHTVREAASLGIRKRTSKANTFGYGAELQVQSEDTSLKYGKKVLHPRHLTGLMKISRDLARRSVMPMDQIVIEEMGIDAAETQEDKFLTGSGSGEPLGVFTASDDGISTSRDVVTGSATNFTADGLLDAKYALKGQYRNGSMGAVRWLMHRDGIKRVAKLKDSDNQYLFRVGMGRMQDNGAPEDVLLGIPVDESERSPNTFTNGNYVAILANWRYYEIADALDIEIQRLEEKYADTNQIGFIGRLKNDGLPTLEEAFVRLKCGT